MSSWSDSSQGSYLGTSCNGGGFPRLRSGYVLRDKFDLRHIAPHGSIGVFAPPGFGKTQLLAFWFYEFRARGLETLWIDAQEMSAGAISTCMSAHLPDPDSRCESPRAIFVDNADCPDIAPVIADMLARRTSGDIMVVAGRNPCVPLDRFQRLFGAEDLRLGDEEANALLHNRLDAASLDALAQAVTLSAGVPALLNIAVADLLLDPNPAQMSLQRGDGLFTAYVSGCLAALRRDEVAVLRALAVPDSFCLDLGAYLTEREDSATVISRLMVDLPFFRQTGPQDYALVPAFRDLVLNRNAAADDIRSCHALAARWYDRQSRYADAIHHAIAGCDLAFAISLMSDHLLDIVTGGELERVRGWLARIPHDVLIRNPDVCLAAALAYLIAGEEKLTEGLLAQLPPDHRLIVQAAALSRQERYDEIERMLKRLRAVDDLSPVVAACYRNLLWSTHQRRGTWQSMPGALLPQPSAAPNPLGAVTSIGLLLETDRLLMLGQAEDAIAAIAPLAERGDAQLGRHSNIATLLAVGLATAYLQAGEDRRAAAILLDRVESIARHKIPMMVCHGFLTAARIAFRRGQADQCLDYLERLESYGIDRDVPRLRALAQAERVRFYALTRQQMLASITLTALEKTQQRVRAETPINGDQVDLEVLLARAYLFRALGKHDALALLLDDADILADKLGRMMDRAEIAMLRPANRQASTDPDFGYFGIGNADRAALHARTADAVTRDRNDAPAQPTQSCFNILGRPVLVKMTDREIHILEGLSRDLSNKAIARELTLSNETVKWYVGRILAKLGARDRRHAVDRARAFGVLNISYAKPASRLIAMPPAPPNVVRHGAA